MMSLFLRRTLFVKYEIPFKVLPVSTCSTSDCVSASNNKIPPNQAGVQNDVIGPPNKVSNLRPVVFYIPPDETTLEKHFRIEREKVQNWNEDFWIKHNSAFLKESNEFRKKKLEGHHSNQTSVSAEEMSEFYKSFLDKNWKTHVSYNFQWYRKNFHLLYLAVKVKISKFMKHHN
ncbi:COA8 family protein [Frankliniella fusca]|uniref:COA8 family protein n=1 Tax=Frankliniella fusca TaxID=407009 RepID=A0AAE1GSG5_9NEOP|nr:COA8 family protein [Frankliniella fusca]